MDKRNQQNEPMMEVYLFEMNQMLDDIERYIMDIEETNEMHREVIDELFRLMHTIKGSSGMMMYQSISKVAHALEDVFSCCREREASKADREQICQLVLASVDYFQEQVTLIQDGNNEKIDEELLNEINSFVKSLLEEEAFEIEEHDAVLELSKPVKYRVVVFFEEGCEMENIRAYSIYHRIKKYAVDVVTEPEDLLERSDVSSHIAKAGFVIYLTTLKDQEFIEKVIKSSLFVEKYSFERIEEYDVEDQDDEVDDMDNQLQIDESVLENNKLEKKEVENSSLQNSQKRSTMIPVNIEKLDALMDLVGEIVITESMVTKNPELKDLELESFYKSARQLRKLTDELQDIVMSIRMVPIANTFRSMQRVVRDMNKKLNKSTKLELVGEETEVDKNVIDHLTDPLIHLLRNALDHGIESSDERIEKGKSKEGMVVLSAENSGGDVIISIEDNGRGLDKNSILEKAIELGWVNDYENDLSDNDIFEYIMQPGFSTKGEVTEYSGRGVGLDIVRQNVEKIGGSISVFSNIDKGTTFKIKIPLTLAIIDSMTIRVGKTFFSLPITSIKESFKISNHKVFSDENGNEMIMLRGDSYSLIRLNRLFNVKSNYNDLNDGILTFVENENQSICVFSDELIGEQQVVVKALPSYIKKKNGIGGCTILGDGSISLIVDVKGLIEMIV